MFPALHPHGRGMPHRPTPPRRRTTSKGSSSMKAVVWHGKEDVRVDTVPDPAIQDPTDVIVKITSTAICGSDLHLFDGVMPTMKSGDILGHEPMGEVVEVGSAVKNLSRG